MTDSDRRQLSGARERRAGAEVRLGTDPLTGHPVLIYQFEGKPLLAGDQLKAPNIPRVLSSDSRAGRGDLVAGLWPNWRRWSEEDGPLEPRHLIGAARALRDAAAHDLAHGDLGPHRLLLKGEQLLVEGYGVPWRPEPGPFVAPEIEGEPTLEGDVWSLASTVQRVGTTVEDETVAAVFELCRSEDPNERPSAEELYLALENLLPETAAGAPSRVAEARQAGVRKAGARESEARNAGARRGTVSVQEDAAQPAEDRRDARLRLFMMGALMAAVVILALLAVYGPQGGQRPATASREATVYVVEVFVAPDDLPPITIHLISSPAGSSLARGDRLGTAPRHLALDRPGTWAFQGSLQDRRSEIVEIQVPEQRSLTLTIPPQ